MTRSTLFTALITLTALATAAHAQRTTTQKSPPAKASTRPASKPSNLYPVTIQKIRAQPILSVRVKCKHADLTGQYGKYFPKLFTFAAMNKGQPAGMPLAIYHAFGKDGTIDVEMACPLKKETADCHCVMALNLCSMSRC